MLDLHKRALDQNSDYQYWFDDFYNNTFVPIFIVGAQIRSSGIINIGQSDASIFELESSGSESFRRAQIVSMKFSTAVEYYQEFIRSDPKEEIRCERIEFLDGNIQIERTKILGCFVYRPFKGLIVDKKKVKREGSFQLESKEVERYNIFVLDPFGFGLGLSKYIRGIWNVNNQSFGISSDLCLRALLDKRIEDQKK